MKRICCSFLVLSIVFSIVFSIPVYAFSSSNNPSQDTSVSVELPLTAIDTNAGKITYNNIITNSSRFDGTLSFDQNENCTIQGMIILDGKLLPTYASGTEFFSRADQDLALYIVSGLAGDDYFSATINVDYHNDDVFMFSTLGTFTDTSIPVQLEFGTFTDRHMLLNDLAASQKTNAPEAKAIVKNSPTTRGRSVDANYRKTVYFDSSTAALSLFSPFKIEKGHNSLVYAKVSANAPALFDMARKLDKNILEVRFNKATITIQSTSTNDNCMVTSVAPNSSKHSVKIPVPIYTGGTRYSELIDPRKYSFSSFEFIFSRVKTYISNNSTKLTGEYLGTQYESPNIFWGKKDPKDTPNAVVLKGAFSYVSGNDKSVMFTATANLTMSYLADTNGTHGVYKPLPLGSKSIKASSDII